MTITLNINVGPNKKYKNDFNNSCSHLIHRSGTLQTICNADEAYTM